MSKLGSRPDPEATKKQRNETKKAEKVCKMSSIDEQILKSAKEIVVKFIEAGRLSPTGFDETFKSIYYTIEEAVQGSREKSEEEK